MNDKAPTITATGSVNGGPYYFELGRIGARLHRVDGMRARVDLF